VNGVPEEGRGLPSRNCALMATIAATHPAALQELADRIGRKSSNYPAH
jgi:predicted transcriptional regulator